MTNDDDDDERGTIKVVDRGGISGTSTAATQRMDKNDRREERSAGAAGASHADGGRRGEDVLPTRPGTEAEGAAGDRRDGDDEDTSLPFDEEEMDGIPVRHVASFPPRGCHPDDVSSLQHTNMDDGSSRVRRRHGDEGERAIAYDDEENYSPDYDYEEEDEAEMQKALQRRNMLIVVTLVLFLGLVIAIAVGVALAVQGGSGESSDANENLDATGAGDDGYGGPGGGIDSDDPLRSSAPSSSPSVGWPCVPVEVGIIFDEYADETGWMLARGEYHPEDLEKNEIVWKSKFYGNAEYSKKADTFTKCLPRGEYAFVFLDKEGDGVCCNHGEGLYVLSSEGGVIAQGREMESRERAVPFELPFVEPAPVDADGDGRDDRLGRIMPYDSSNFTEGVDCENFHLAVLTDDYGLETTWELFEGADRSGVPVADGGPYGSGHEYAVDYCLASPREYVLYVYDWDRRGLCCGSGEGWYKATSGPDVIIESDGSFGGVDVTRFALRPSTSAPTAAPASAPSAAPASAPTAALERPVGTGETAYPTDPAPAPVGTGETAHPADAPTTPPPSIRPTGSPAAPAPPPTGSPTRPPTAAPTAGRSNATAADGAIAAPPPTPASNQTLDQETIEKVTSAMDEAEQNVGKGNEKGSSEDEAGKGEKEPKV